MKIYPKHLFTMIALLSGSILLGQENPTSSSDFLTAIPRADRLVWYDLTDAGIHKEMKFGADLAWANEQNFRRVILFTGKDQLDIVRASFQPTHELVDGQLHPEQLEDLNWRLYLINTYAGSNIDLQLNSDHPSVDPWYVGNAANWAELIKITAQKFEEAGHQVVTVAPFNEPDYSATGQGTMQDFYNVVIELKKDPYFDGKRISGGNTLNTDRALEWYNFLVPAGINEGNTHQLAGSFDNYANFFEVVRSNGHFAANDELHNIMEAMVGYEYGMQSGIWWGPAEYARGEIVKAMDGERLGYAEHRPNWTAAAVYRYPDGQVKAFCGESERQAITTTYKYIAKDRPVFYDGHGPTHEFFLEMPGAPNSSYYQSPEYHPNAERVINITWGDDIQPVIDGEYVLVNKASGLVMQAPMSQGANVQVANASGAASQQWEVKPVDSRIGGDFSYWQIKPAADAALSLDLINFSLDEGANIHLWSAGTAGNQQWYLEYAEDGWFYIRSRESSHCIEVSSLNPGGNVVQGIKDESANQQWRLIPVGAEVEFKAPFANASLEASRQSASILLDWAANPETDISGYTVLRSTTSGGPYHTIARNVTATAFVDHTTLADQEYYYVIRAVDRSLNRSDLSNEVSAIVSGENTLVSHYAFDGNTADSTENLFHGVTLGSISYGEAMIGNEAISLNGSDAFIQLPATIAHHERISIASWVRWGGGADWQRIFDFGNGEEEYMMMTPAAGGRLTFTLKSDMGELSLSAAALNEDEWTHVAVTIGGGYAYLYVNGEPADFEFNVDRSPMDFKPVLNYIGRSQYEDPLFEGSLDDFRVYNYDLDPEAVRALADTTTVDEPGEVLGMTSGDIAIWPNPVNDVLTISNHHSAKTHYQLYNLNGAIVRHGYVEGQSNQLDLSHLPDGLYLLKVDDSGKSHLHKIYISH